jgi:ElaB/YqjD/DUF883 family membrane-anchored ribosome-binding protein
MTSENPAALRDRLREAAHSAVDKAADAAGPASQWLEQKRSYLADEQNNLKEYLSTSPVKAVAVAFIVGLIVGRLTS